MSEAKARQKTANGGSAQALMPVATHPSVRTDSHVCARRSPKMTVPFERGGRWFQFRNPESNTPGRIFLHRVGKPQANVGDRRLSRSPTSAGCRSFRYPAVGVPDPIAIANTCIAVTPLPALALTVGSVTDATVLPACSGTDEK